MKKSIYLLGMAVAALSSCSQSDVVEMPENRAIGFSTFVNNNTRATEITTDDLTKFNVFGNYGSSWTKVYTNVAVNGSGSNWTPTEIAYWEKSQKYRFAAYSDGNAEIDDKKVSYDAGEHALTFTSYNVADKDLLAALPDEITTDTDPSDQNPVSLNFSHMLSQVNFTFKNTDSRDYVMEISNLQIASAIKTGNGTFKNDVITWTGTANETYTFAKIDDIAKGDVTAEHPCGSIFVIPQDNGSLTATFTATFKDAAGKQLGTKNFTASVKSDEDTHFWKNGYRYNYTATINGKIVSDNTTEIKFTVNEVKGWENESEKPITPTPVPQP